MKSLKQLTDQIVKKNLSDESSTFNFAKFESILNLLKPHLDLDKEQMAGIFEALDKESKGFIGNSEMVELMGTLSEIPVEDEEPELETLGNRRSRATVTYDITKKAFRQSIGNDNPMSPGSRASHLDYSLIEGLGLEKLSDLKQLFQIIAQSSNGNYVSAKEVYRLYDDLPLLIEFEEVKTICELLSDTKSNLSIKHINSLLSEIEKMILNSMMGDGAGASPTRSILLDDITSVKVGQRKLEIKLEEEGADEDDPNKEEEEDETELLEEADIIGFEEMEEKFLDPLTAIWDEMANMKHKTNELVKHINAILKIKEKLRKFFAQLEKTTKSINTSMKNQSAKENVLRSKIGSLEAEIKSSASVIESLLKENENLFVEISAQASVIKDLEKKDRDISKKIHEMILLESKNKTAEVELKRQMDLVKEKEREIERLQKEKEEAFKRLMETEKEDEDLLGDEARKHQRQIEELNDNYKAILGEKEKQAKKQLERIERLEQLYDGARENLGERDEFIVELKQEIEDLKLRLESAGRMSTARLSSYGNLGNQLANRASMLGQRLSNALSVSARASLRGTLNPSQRFSNLKGEYRGHSPTLHDPYETIEEQDEDDDEIAKQKSDRKATLSHQEEFPEPNDFSQVPSDPLPIPDKKTTIDLRKTRNHPLLENESPSNGLSPWNKEEASVLRLVNFDEKSSAEFMKINRDYLNLFGKEKVKRILAQFKDDSSEFEIFSEKIVRINRYEKKEKNMMLITKNAFYNIRPQTYRLVRRIPLEIINKVTLAEHSATLCCIHVSQEFDYLIETFKRADFVVFLMQMFKLRGLKQFPIDYQVGFVITNSGKNTKHISKFDQSQLKLHVASAYKNAIYYGYIMKLEEKFLFGHAWKEFFGVLTSVGLLLFKNAGDLKNGTLVPILGSQYIDNPGVRYGKKYAIKIVSADRTKKELFGFDSSALKGEWSAAIKKLQNSDLKSTAQQEVEARKETLDKLKSPRKP